MDEPIFLIHLKGKTKPPMFLCVYAYELAEFDKYILKQNNIHFISENNEELELKCVKLAEELATKSSDVSDRRGRKRKRTEKGRDWDRETSVSEEQPSRQPSSSEDKANNKKQENKSIKKKSPKKKKKGETSNKQQKAKEKKLQKTAEIVSRQSLAAQFFGTVADTEKQGDAKDRNTPIITVHDHDSELSVTTQQMTEKQNRTTTFQSSKDDHTRRNTTFTRDLTTVNVCDDSPISPALAAPKLAPVNFSVMTPINTPSPPRRGGTLTNQKTCTTLSQPDYVTPSATPTSDRHPQKMAQDGSPADSINNWQQENEDFGGLFRSSLSLAYGDDDDDDTGNIPQTEYSFLEDLNESGTQSSPESPMAASNSSSTCANCEQLKRQIDVLKRNQIPGTHLQ